MASMTHPFDTDTLYQCDEHGNIVLTRGNSRGVFTRWGVHIDGDILQADPQLCNWVGNNPDPANTIPRPGKNQPPKEN
ncbi:MAG: hypothetical protein NXH85_03520 [Pseudomonadaceae bacterium]|nr:hypothetical protein [Pseudomonadaceae bacterium]